MKANYKKYNLGGVAQSFGSPMITSGMQTVTGNWGGNPVSVFAKGGYTKRVSKDDLYRVREKTKHERTDTEGVGNFELPKDVATRYLYELDDFDKNLVKDIKLKPNEHIFRYESYYTKIGGYIPFVKINLDNQMVYFVTENAWDGGDIEFGRKGEKAQFINISDKYANGGQSDEIQEGDSFINTTNGEKFYIQEINEDNKKLPYYVIKSNLTDLAKVISIAEWNRFVKNGLFQKVEIEYAEIPFLTFCEKNNIKPTDLPANIKRKIKIYEDKYDVFMELDEL
jgi:hypothetical protein